MRVAAALEELPEGQREAVAMHYWEGLTLNEVAQEMGRTAAAVAGLLQRGLRTLRRQLKEAE